MTRLLKRPRRTPVLQTPAFGCLKGTPGINITWGCLHACVYCYARGFPAAPRQGEVHLYDNLPEVLKWELGRKRRLPRWVAFSTASDPFQDLDEVLAITYAVMKLLLERGIGVSFLTKGEIPSDFLSLFRNHPDRVTARLGLTTLDHSLQRLFEPYAPPPERRLATIRRLMDSGVRVSVRLDPVIAGATDREENLENLFIRLKVLGVRDLSLSYLVMRPAIMNRFLTELPATVHRSLLKPYLGQPWRQVITSAHTRLLPRDWRHQHFQTVKRLAAGFSLRVRLCGCKNPDLEWESCNPWEEGGQAEKKELIPDLFSLCEGGGVR